MSEGHIWIDDVIDQNTYDHVKQQLGSLSSVNSIGLHIASPGGSVRAGNKIFHLLKNSGKIINPIIEGQAESMGSYLALLGKYTGGKSRICNPSTYMIHLPQNEVAGTADDLVNGANELIAIQTEMAEAYAFASGLPKEKTLEMMKVTTRLNATQARDLGFIDEVIGTYAEAVALGQTITKPMKPEEKKSKLGGIIKMLGELTGITQSTPKGMDLKTKDGKMLSVQSEDGEFAGKPATIDGQPANGTYMLEDGRSITCENGVVKSVQQAAAAAPTAPVAPVVPPVTAAAPVVPVLTAEQRLAAIEAEFNTLKAQKEASDSAKALSDKLAADATAAKTTALQKVAEVQKEIVALSKAEVGDQTPPSKGMKPIVSPYAQAGDEDEWVEKTVVFLNEHFKETLKDRYPVGHWEKYIDSFAKRNNSGRGPRAVSILETNFNYTWNGILNDQIYYKPTQRAPAMADLFTIDQEIKSHKQYNLVTQLNKVVKPYTGCARTFNGNRQLITNTTVRTKEFQVSESWCKDDFTGYLTGAYNILAQEWLKTGIDSFDPSGTPINRVIDKLLSEAIARDIFRRVSFAAGNSSDDDYNQIDGLWDRLIDSSGAANYCVVRAGSALGTAALSSGNALTYLEQAYAQSNILLKEAFDIGTPTFWVTRSIWDNYYNSLIGTGAVTEQQFTNLVKGLSFLTYKGIPVRPIGLWDTFLAESDNPLFAVTRHLILLTIKENHILGVENGADLNKLEGWYERKDRQFYYEADFKLGYNYLHCDLQTIMY